MSGTERGIGTTCVMVVIAAAVALFIGAVISITRSRLRRGMQLVWLVFTFALPILGSMLWFAVGRRDSLH
ncbi:PLD nuclease N-terminal domain-containing protein [Streptomyces sp. NPDC093510]|uniref:PLD nuclease N-terminal domain-containing protein n=1 Tax=Streptomyces sp. NPDC093510 TaxID=3155199 RepID=UPI0034257182